LAFKNECVVKRLSSNRYACLRDRAGATAAEFALTLPLFIALVFGTIEYGIVFFVYADMQASALSVARQVAVNDLDPSRAVAVTKAKLPGWVVGASTVTVSQSNAADPSSNVISINVRAPAVRASPVSIFTRVVPWTINVTASANQERRYED
jgi:Flp pilus assembly protein TadG